MLDMDKTSLGIEFGSTRIKAVIIDECGRPLASGSYEWENKLEDGYWTYSLEMVHDGLRECYKELKQKFKTKYGIILTKVGTIGISAMMHGYLAFDDSGSLLVPFRTWRNTTTEKAAEKLSSIFGFNIPQRWSIAHLYQAIINDEEHVKNISHVATLGAYVHYMLTGERVIGIGDASGMFPIDSEANDYDKKMAAKFYELTGIDIEGVFPKVLLAGRSAGTLTAEGAKLLDPHGDLKGGIPLCPPEGDAGTGMTATNSVKTHTGNVSAGTSVFAMVVLDRQLTKVYEEIDMVTTPAGKPVAMVHCNNFTSDINAWVDMFEEMLNAVGQSINKGELFDRLFQLAMEAEPSGGGLMAYNYYAGEPITGTLEGRPLFMRKPDSRLTLPEFMRTLIFSAMATLKIGMNILTGDEKVNIESMLGHGGFFKTEKVGQSLMASALGVPVSVMESAGEGGAWGIALLASYMKKTEIPLEEYLEKYIFCDNKGSRIVPDKQDSKGFDKFMKLYIDGLEVEKAAIESFK